MQQHQHTAVLARRSVALGPVSNTSAREREIHAFQHLPEHTQSAILDFHSQSKAQNTRNAYASDERLFQRYLHDVLHKPIDVADAAYADVLAFVVHMQQQGRAKKTIERRLAALRHAVVALRDGDVPADIQRQFDDAIGGVRRAIGTERNRGKKPILWSMLEQMHAHHQQSDAPGLIPQLSCLYLLLQWHAASRIDEVCALRWKNVDIRADGVKITFDRSKTDQEGRGASIGICRKPAGQESLCCVQALERWKEASSPCADEDRVSRGLTRKGLLTSAPFTQKRGAKLIKDAVVALGGDPSAYSTHSQRAGFISEHVNERGRPLAEVMQQSRHTSYQAASTYVRDGKDLFAHGF